MSKIRINQGRVMNGWFRYVGTLIVICGVVGTTFTLNNVLGFAISLVLAILLIMLWTSFHVVEIDMDTKQYRDLTLVMGRKWGEPISFEGIEKVFINEVGVQRAHTTYSTGVRRVTKSTTFKAFLKFTNGDKLFLLSDDDESALKGRLKAMVEKMGTTII